MKNIYIIGEDKRQVCLKKLYKDNLVENISEANIVVLPTPVSKNGETITGTDMLLNDLLNSFIGKIVFGGKFTKEFKKKMDDLNIVYYDLTEFEELAIKNAIPTAEGVIYKAMELLNTTIFDLNVLILGFGKCGKVLADRFYGLKANVFCEARNKKDIAQIKAMGYNCVDIINLNDVLPKMDLVINTIPFMILDKERIDCMSKNVIIIDVASNPGGTDFEYCSKKNITAVLELGIPAKIAPMSAAEFIKEVIDKFI